MATITETTLRRTPLTRKDGTIKGILFEALDPKTGEVLAQRTSGSFDFHGCLLVRGLTHNTGLMGQGEAGQPFTSLVGYFGREDLLQAGIRKQMGFEFYGSSHHRTLAGLPAFTELLVARVPARPAPVAENLSPADWFRVALAKQRSTAQAAPGQHQILLNLSTDDEPLGRLYQWHEAHECFYPDHGGQPDTNQAARMVAHAAQSIEQKHPVRLLALDLRLEAGSRGSGTTIAFDSNNYAACR